MILEKIQNFESISGIREPIFVVDPQFAGKQGANGDTMKLETLS